MTAIEITVLSGSRQGERLRLQEGELIVGDGGNCDLAFDPERDRGARGIRAVIRLTGDGWQIESLGRPRMLVNHDPLGKPVPLASGDVVRLSEEGPDFRFTIKQGAGDRHDQSDTPSSGVRIGGRSDPISPRRSRPVVQTEFAPVRPADRAKSRKRSRPTNRRMAAGILGLIALGALAALAVPVGMWWVSRRPAALPTDELAAIEEPPAKGASRDSAVPVVFDRRDEVVEGSGEGNRGLTPPARLNTRQSDERTDDDSTRHSPLATRHSTGPVVVLALEGSGDEGGQLTLFAQATPIRYRDHDMLLTSGRIALEMARYGGSFRAVPLDSDTGKSIPIEVEQAFVHELYAKALDRDEPESAALFNVGVLTIRGPLREPVAVAEADSSRSILTPGNTLQCWGAFPAWQPGSRDRQAADGAPHNPATDQLARGQLELENGNAARPEWLMAESREVELVSIDRLADEPDAPTLLTISFPDQVRAEGAGLFNARGKLVAVCGGPLPTDGKPGGGTPYAAAAIDRATIAALWDPGLPTLWRGFKPQAEPPGE